MLDSNDRPRYTTRKASDLQDDLKFMAFAYNSSRREHSKILCGKMDVSVVTVKQLKWKDEAAGLCCSSDRAGLCCSSDTAGLCCSSDTTQ